jgi:hypothetical protein
MVKVYAELTEGDVAAAHRSASPLDQWSGRLTTRAGADRRAARAYRGARAGFGVR